MITFLSSPKPFVGIAKENQYRAIRSWLKGGRDVEVILYGNSEGIDEAGQALGVTIVKDIDCTPSGIPYFGAIVQHASACGRYDSQVYLNCDILLVGLQGALKLIPFDRFLLIGQRIDMGPHVTIDVCQPSWFHDLTDRVKEGNAFLNTPSAIDYFAFPRGMWKEIPDIVIGRGGYDTALLAHCQRSCIPIVDGTYAVAALHQFHDYSHIKGGAEAVLWGREASINHRFVGSTRSAMMVSDARYVLKDSMMLSQPCRGDTLRQWELKLRYQSVWPRVWMLLRVIWRILQLAGLTRVHQPASDDLIEALRKNLRIAE